MACQAEDMEERSFHLVTKSAAEKSVFLIDEKKRVYYGARAVGETMKRLSFPWKIFGTILAFPLVAWLAEPFYRLVAWQRTRLSRWFVNEPCGQFFSEKAEDWLDQQAEEDLG